MQNSLASPVVLLNAFLCPRDPVSLGKYLKTAVSLYLSAIIARVTNLESTAAESEASGEVSK